MAAGPIFVTADEPLLVFESLDRALGELEWQDVEDGIYRGYDRDGRLIEFSTEQLPKKSFRRFSERKVIATVEEQPGHAEELQQTLVRILSKWSDVSRRELDAAPLGRLQDLAVERFGIG